MKLKKITIAAVGAALFLTSLAGCQPSQGGESSGGTSETQPGTSLPAGDPKSVSVLVQSSWINEGTKAAFANVEAGMNARFEFEELPEGDAGDQLILAKMATNEVPDILWWQSATTVDNLIGSDKFEDLSGDWQQYYDADAIASRAYTVNGKLIQAPFGDATVFGMCYNKSVFENNGVEVPGTWDELTAACETFKEAGVTPVYFSGKDSWTLQILPLDSFAKENKAIEDLAAKLETHKLTWSELSDSKQVLDNMLELVRNGYVQESYLSDTYADAQTALLEGTAAMYPQASWIAPQLANLAEDAAELSNLGMFVIPGSDPAAIAAYSTPTGFLVPSSGKNKEYAKAAVNALCSKDAAAAYYKAQPGIPFIKGVEGNAVGIQKDASDIVNSGRAYVQPTMIYEYGSLATFVQDMLIGNKDSAGVLKAMDDAYAAQANAKNDPNWN